MFAKEQLEFCGTTTLVSGIEYSHNGEVLYRLKEVPGLWPEACLVDAMLVSPEWWGFPATSSYYRIKSLDNDSLVSVCDKHGITCLVVRALEKERLTEAMKKVARMRHVVGFENRYGFRGTFNWRESTRFVEYYNLRDFRVIEIRGTSQLCVCIRDATNQRELLCFDGVIDVKQHAPVGMHVYAIAKCKEGNLCRFLFVNCNVGDDSSLEVVAERMKSKTPKS